MASRKTYFGVGWPKDPADPGSGPADAGARDAEPIAVPAVDNSAPTVVDDEKVAEGLAQLRSWYQSDTPEGSRPIEPSALPPAPDPGAQQGQPGTRPTAVGHASGQAAALPRPVAPDPMRATMFGHDIHRFDFDMPSSAPDPQPAANPPPAAGRGAAGSVSANPRPADAPPRAPEATPRAPEWGRTPQPDAYRLADYLRRQAAQPHAPAAAMWVSSSDDTDVRARAARRIPIVVFGIGFAALTVAILTWVLSREGSNGPAPTPPAAAVPVAPSTGIDRLAPPSRPPAPAIPERTRRDVASEQTFDRSNGQDLAPSAPAKTTRPRPRPVKAVVAPREEEATDSPPPAEPRAPEEAASGSPAGSADAGRAIAPDRSPDRPTEPARPQRSTDRKRDKKALLGDTDSTLPPSLGD